MRGEFVELERDRLYYFAAGTRGHGDPVVFLHGFPTTSHLWQEVVPLLPAGRRYIVADQLGCGRSVAAPDADLGLDAHARRVLCLLDHLGVKRTSIVAHGVGALTALRVWQLDPSRVSDLALVNPAPPEAPLRGWGSLRWIRGVTRWASSALGASLLHGALVKRFVDASRATHSADLYARPFAAQGGRDALRAHLHALTGPISLPDMGDTPPRASIICGRGDRNDRRAAAAFAASIPGATLHEVPAAGHFIPEEHPEQLAVLLASHLTS